LQIWNYLVDQASIDVADRVIGDIYDGFEKIGKSPGVGHLREDLTGLPVRFLRVHRYMVVYAVDERPIGIVRILHGARDIAVILGLGGEPGPPGHG
jgi:plasmid stabilization system protein ParE